MLKTILRGRNLEKWKLDHGLIVDSAAECFGVTKEYWESVVSNDSIITSKRIVNLYLFYKAFPEMIPVTSMPRMDQFYLSLKISDNVAGWEKFGKLIGLSRTSVIRMIDGGFIGRETECYIKALLKMKSKGYNILDIMEYLSDEADRNIKHKLLKGWRLEEWKNKYQLITLSASTMLGIQTAKLKKLIYENEAIIQKRLVLSFLIYDKYPESMPIRKSPDYRAFYEKLGFSNTNESTYNLELFAGYFGVSRTTVFRMLKKNSASRDIEKLVQGLDALSLTGSAKRNVLQELSKNADIIVRRGVMASDLE
ncbi:hypothetical protein ABLA30_13825 [Xenorhabdus nematophila]|uniref:hypothetical protein n=1 Tax=Xenorhabdus nematophila TaxID=628 RepID=UPI0032B7E073